MNYKRKVIGGAALVLLIGGAAWAAGVFPGFPLASQSSLTSPLTGNETIPADTNLGQGINPATELLTPGMLGAGPYTGAFKNALIGGGDFGLNLWQRGTTTSAITNTATYTADRWAAIGGSSGSVTITKETGATDIPSVGFTASARVQRANTNTDTTAVCIGQPLITANSVRLQGANYAVFSFHGYAPSTFSASGGTVNAYLVSGTGTNGTTANMFSGGWTGYAAASPVLAGSDVSGLSYSSAVSGAAAIQLNTGNAGVPLTSTWHRYWAAFKVPAGANQLGVELCFTPVGTAGTADYFEFTGAQLEGNSAGMPTPVERLSTSIEANRQLAYYYEIDEVVSAVNEYGVCQGGAAATTAANCMISFPVPMWKTPTLTFTAGTLKATVGTAGAAAAVSGLVITNATPYTANCSATVTSVSTITGFLEDGNSTGGGKIKFSAEL